MSAECSFGCCHEHIGWHVHAQIDDREAVTFQQHPDEALADVVEVTLHGAQDRRCPWLGRCPMRDEAAAQQARRALLER